MENGVARLFIGTKTNKTGCLFIKYHTLRDWPKSIYVKKWRGAQWVWFFCEDGLDKSSFFGYFNLRDFWLGGIFSIFYFV